MYLRKHEKSMLYSMGASCVAPFWICCVIWCVFVLMLFLHVFGGILRQSAGTGRLPGPQDSARLGPRSIHAWGAANVQGFALCRRFVLLYFCTLGTLWWTMEAADRTPWSPDFHFDRFCSEFRTPAIFIAFEHCGPEHVFF